MRLEEAFCVGPISGQVVGWVEGMGWREVTFWAHALVLFSKRNKVSLVLSVLSVYCSNSDFDSMFVQLCVHFTIFQALVNERQSVSIISHFILPSQ